MTGATPAQQVDALFAYMERRGQSFYDEVVTQLEHALQCAKLAEESGSDPELITAALFHDIGHIILDEHNAETGFLDRDLNHEAIGATYLEPFFPPAVLVPIRLHVPAKRYLCSVDASYHAGLSEASKRSLKVQGGPMTSAERMRFEQVPFYQSALALRRWDDLAKVQALAVPDLESYRDFVEVSLQ